MSLVNFPASNETWRQLVGNGLTYSVPRFQRDYSWTEDEWDDLWQDIQATLRPDGDPAHYMGYLVLQTKDNKTFEVIDGQQRLTTLSLFALAVLKALHDLAESGVDTENNRQRIQQLRNTFVGYLDPVTLVSRNKLTLNRNTDAYYRDYVVPLQKLPQRKLKTSERNLRRAFEWLLAKVRQEYGGHRDGAVLARVLDALSDKLFFTVIKVTDELNAFKVFETLNARGVRLSPTDLLKNYLFSVVYRDHPHDTEIETLERRWDAMVGKLGGESFPDFLRTHWNSRHKLVRESDLFKTIRSATSSKEHVFRLVREMERDLDVYAAFQDPEDDVWEREQRPYIRQLRMFNVRQPRPLLLAAHRVFDANGFTTLAKACSVVSFRYNVIGGLATAEQERVYNATALRLASGDIRTPAQAIEALAPIYVNDEAFKSSFAEKTLDTTSARNTRVVRDILLQIERHLSGADHDADSARITIEHVLPVNPGPEWQEPPTGQDDELVHRLGNLTLLLVSTNRQLSNSSFNEKRDTYAKSNFQLTRKIAEDNATWDVDRIAARQRWMASQATAIWRIPNL